MNSEAIVLKSSYMGGMLHEQFDTVETALAEAFSTLVSGSSIPIAIYKADGEVLLDYSGIMKAYRK